MKNWILILCAAVGLAGCASSSRNSSSSSAAVDAAAMGRTSPTNSFDTYKLDLAQRIASANSAQVFSGRPQALLRSVVVLKYWVDRDGNLVRSEIMRSNRDATTEATALASLRNSAPFPKPASTLLQHGRVELSETWLFNSDGRFQLRTIAEPQMGQ